MTTKQAAQHNARFWGISLGLLLVAVGLAAYAFVATPAVSTPATGQAGSMSPPPPPGGARFGGPDPAALDPAQQGVMEYLRVHNAVRPASAQAAARDPAAPSALGYVRAHDLTPPAAFGGPAAGG